MTEQSQDSPQNRTTGGNGNWSPPAPGEIAAHFPGYTILELVAIGGMGAVYKAVQTSLDRTVALKILPKGIEGQDPSFEARFRNEAKLMARLLHPGVVAVFDSGQTSDGQLYFVMEFVDGKDLHQLIQEKGRLSAKDSIAVTLHVCDALTAAHALGIVHRDIKPANVLINREGQIKVADFGLARVDGKENRGFSSYGQTYCTPDYAAPEIMSGGGEVDARADLYAVGVMLYEMLAGKVPQGVWEKPSVRVPGLDPRIDTVITRAMQSDPANRYQTSADLRKDLNDILTPPVAKAKALHVAAPKNAVPVTSNKVAIAAPKKKSMAVPVGIGAAVLCVAGIVFLLSRDRSPEPPPVKPTVVEQGRPTPPAPPVKPATLLPEVSPPPPKAPEIIATAPEEDLVPPPEDELPWSPNVATVAPPDTATSFNGHKYLFVPEMLAWPDAKKKAEEMGGYLAVITNKEENDFVEALLGPKLAKGGSNSMCWLGAYQERTDSPWTWVQGEKMQFSEWATDQPNRAKGDPEKEKMTHYLVIQQTETYLIWNDIGIYGNGWESLVAGFLVEWDPPAETATPPENAAPPSLEVARKMGGRIRTWAPSGGKFATGLAGADAFEDVIQVAVNEEGWAARRRDGSIHQVAWAKDASQNGGEPVVLEGFKSPFMNRGHVFVIPGHDDGKIHKVFGGARVTFPAPSHANAAAILSTNQHLTSIDADGRILASSPWPGAPDTLKSPPDDFFLGARVFSAGAKSYVSARPGLPVRAWNVEQGKIEEFPSEISDIVEIDMGPHNVLLRSANGKVFTRPPDGLTPPLAELIPPRDLPPAVAVRAGTGLCAIQAADGRWTAWGKSSSGLIDQVRKIGPAIDMDLLDVGGSGAFLIWIEPLDSYGENPEESPPESLPPDLAERLAEIDAQFQAAYDRDIAPPHSAAVKALDAKFLAAVSRLLDAATKAGRLEESVTLRDEIARVNSQAPMPAMDTGNIPDSLKQIRATYRTALAKLEADRDGKAKPYHARRDQLLGEYQAELTRQKRLDDALKVKTLKEKYSETKAAEPVAGSIPTVPVTPSPAPPATPPAPALTDAALAATAKWILANRGNFSILLPNGNKRFVEQSGQIPAGQFEVVRVKLEPSESPSLSEFAALASLTSLESLELRGNFDRISNLESLRNLTKLKSLGIHARFVKAGDLTALEGMSGLSFLALVLKDQGGEGLSALAKLPALRTLRVEMDGSYSSQGARELASLAQLARLELKALDRKSQGNLALLADHPNLGALRLEKVTPSADFLGAIARIPKLRELVFNGSSGFETEALSALRAADGRLAHLEFSYSTALNDEHVRAIVAALPNLQRFDRQWTGAGCTGNALRELAKLPKLTFLGWSGATDEECGLFADFPALDTLSVTNSPKLTNKCFDHFAGLSKLKSLSLRKNQGVTKAAFDQFRNSGVKYTLNFE